MKIIKINRIGNYTNHGIGHTEHDGYSGTTDNRMSIKSAIAMELNRCIVTGEQYLISIDDKSDNRVYIK